MPYADRRADPGAEIKSQTVLGEPVRLHADEDGVVKVHNADQEEVANQMQLPVVREIKAEGDKPAAKPKEG